MPLFINVMRKTKLRPPWWTLGKEMCYYRQLESATTTNLREWIDILPTSAHTVTLTWYRSTHQDLQYFH